MLETQGDPPKFSDIFEAAGVSRGSAYRIYIGIDDLLQDLATEWLTNFVDYLKSSETGEPPETWSQLSDLIVRRGADYWARTTDTLRVLPRIRSNAPASYSLAVRELSVCLSEIFNRFFVVPEVSGWMTKLAFFTQICDITFTDAIRNDGHISEQRLTEAETLCRTYLAFHLPARLPARTRSDS